jgi:hypothetical protein
VECVGDGDRGERPREHSLESQWRFPIHEPRSCSGVVVLRVGRSAVRDGGGDETKKTTPQVPGCFMGSLSGKARGTVGGRGAVH